MSKCIVCTQVKGKRKCKIKDGEFICPPCCAKSRTSACFGCDHHIQAQEFGSRKEEMKIPEHFTAMLDPDIEDKVDNILQLAEKGQIEIGANKMRSLLHSHPSSHTVNYGMGVIYLLQKKEDQALDYFDKAVKIFPFFTEAWFNKALIHKNKLEIYELVTSLQEVVKSADKGTYLEKKANELLKDFTKAVKKEQRVDLDTYIKMMKVYKDAFDTFTNNKYSEAIMGFNKVIDIIPNHYQSYGNLGLCYGYLEDKQTAIEYLEKAIKINPKYEPAIMNLRVINNLPEGKSLKDIGFKETVFRG